VLLDRELFDELRRADPAAGARSVVRAHAARGVEVPTEDEGAFLDIDSPEDYQRRFGVAPPPGT
jgi:CTP:molybdopterin cytidylyltransferase MocA